MNKKEKNIKVGKQPQAAAADRDKVNKCASRMPKELLDCDAKEEIDQIAEDWKKEKHRVLIIWGSDLHDVPDMKEHVLDLARENLESEGDARVNVEEFGSDAEKTAFLKGLRYDNVTYDNFLILTDKAEIDEVLAKIA